MPLLTKIHSPGQKFNVGRRCHPDFPSRESNLCNFLQRLCNSQHSLLHPRIVGLYCKPAKDANQCINSSGAKYHNTTVAAPPSKPLIAKQIVILTQHENNTIKRIRPDSIASIHSRSQPTPTLRLRVRLSVRHIRFFHAEFSTSCFTVSLGASAQVAGGAALRCQSIDPAYSPYLRQGIIRRICYFKTGIFCLHE